MSITLPGSGAGGSRSLSNTAHAPGQTAAVGSFPHSSSLCKGAGLGCTGAVGHLKLLLSDLMTSDKLCSGTTAALRSSLSFADSICYKKKNTVGLSFCALAAEVRPRPSDTTRLVKAGVKCIRWVRHQYVLGRQSM